MKKDIDDCRKIIRGDKKHSVLKPMAEKRIAVTILTTEGSVNMPLTIEQVGALAEMLRTEKEPVSVHTLEDSYDAVGMLIQSKSKEGFPKIILIGDE